MRFFSGPLYLLVFVVVFLGFLAGAFVAWNAARRHRRAAKQAQKRVVTLESDLAATRARAESAEERAAQLSSVKLEPAMASLDAPEGS